MSGYNKLFEMVKNRLEKRGKIIDDCETYLVCFSESYDDIHWDIGHTLLIGGGSYDNFEWLNDFDEGQQYYKLHYVVELSEVYYRLDLAHYKNINKRWIF